MTSLKEPIQLEKQQLLLLPETSLLAQSMHKKKRRAPHS